MPINFYPKAGTVIICDFAGYVVPEIVKKRPVVVISPKHKTAGLVTVVPLSTTSPNPTERFHMRIKNYLKMDGSEVWVKADLVARVRLARLDRIKKKRMYTTYIVNQAELKQIRKCVALSIGVDIGDIP